MLGLLGRIDRTRFHKAAHLIYVTRQERVLPSFSPDIAARGDIIVKPSPFGILPLISSLFYVQVSF